MRRYLPFHGTLCVRLAQAEVSDLSDTEIERALDSVVAPMFCIGAVKYLRDHSALTMDDVKRIGQ